ncbi:MAG: NAD(P)H-hydrate dehydratase [Flaviaesturariibacter sp.]|nr:NAD(P)H-hydrate dehydratase [Flaviaesturariibacter sp.]
MFVPSSDQVRRWDAYTIRHEPVTSVALMERASQACTDWLLAKGWSERPCHIFCGKGNNGGDGLAITRQLLGAGYHVEVSVLETGRAGSPEFEHQLQLLHAISDDIVFLSRADQFPYIPPHAIVIDALFGTGLNAPLTGLAADLVRHLNDADATAVSIDLPSGLFADRASTGDAIIHATNTLTFETMKMGLLVQENGPFIGDLSILRIGLHPGFLREESVSFETIDLAMARARLRPRSRFSHKGSFGHALLAAGSWGKMGACVLAARASLRSGLGLLTCFVPACGYAIMQTSVPEAMVVTDDDVRSLSSLPPDTDRYDAIGVGPGIGTGPETGEMLASLLRTFQKPLVLDADALNLISQRPELLESVPAGSILTPHPREFDRLFGAHASDFDRIETARRVAAERQLVVLIKGHHTVVATPGRTYFNTTGNAGLAKGGSGDILTGLLTALLAQGYPPAHAALLGVYLHGLAGDLCAGVMGMESMLPGDVLLFFGRAFHEIRGTNRG